MMLTMVLGFLNIGTSELFFILLVALLLFGGKKLPELARGLGRGIREFKDASENIKRDISEQINSFEKEIEVKDVFVDDPKREGTNSVARENRAKSDSVKVNTTEGNSAEGNSAESPLQSDPVAPGFTPPAGTYQHTPRT